MKGSPRTQQEKNNSKTMTASDVIEFYTEMQNSNIDVWIDGGWGVDALLGKQTRPHQDLDIAIQQKDVKGARSILEDKGYNEVKRDNKWNFVMGDKKGHEIDFHAFIFDNNKHIVKGIEYPDGSLSGKGEIEGHTVKCISPEHLVQFHTGYEPRESDIHDVTALCEKFDLDYPDEYLDKNQR